jgi:hypothetical protein
MMNCREGKGRCNGLYGILGGIKEYLLPALNVQIYFLQRCLVAVDCCEVFLCFFLICKANARV